MRDQGWAYWHPLSQLARMTEELGEVARLVNHLYGEKPKKADEPEQDLGLELADLLYTMICLANDQKVDLQQALERAMEKYRSRDHALPPRLPRAVAPAPVVRNRQVIDGGAPLPGMLPARWKGGDVEWVKAALAVIST